VHELSIASAVLDTALRHAGGRPVTVVSVRAGAMRQIVPRSLEFYFEIVARDTPCEGAALRLTEIATELRCGGCEARWSPLIPAFRCPACAGGDVAIVTGGELEVDYIEVDDIEVEQEEAACIAPG
jgi:hydrogenase nickel incorporation protein HypA/HybF